MAAGHFEYGRYGKHFVFRAPKATHFGRISCEQARCAGHTYGWRTKILEGDGGLGDAQAHYIRKQSGRRFTEERAPDGLTVFTFEPGQTCFLQSSHYGRLDRPPRFYLGTVDQMREVSPQGWHDAFGEDRERVAQLVRRG
jgi:hypothetical protein